MGKNQFNQLLLLVEEEKSENPTQTRMLLLLPPDFLFWLRQQLIDFPLLVVVAFIIVVVGLFIFFFLRYYFSRLSCLNYVFIIISFLQLVFSRLLYSILHSCPPARWLTNRNLSLPFMNSRTTTAAALKLRKADNRQDPKKITESFCHQRC